jgi:hypothetical protein
MWRWSPNVTAYKRYFWTMSWTYYFFLQSFVIPATNCNSWSSTSLELTWIMCGTMARFQGTFCAKLQVRPSPADAKNALSYINIIFWNESIIFHNGLYVELDTCVFCWWPTCHRCLMRRTGGLKLKLTLTITHWQHKANCSVGVTCAAQMIDSSLHWWKVLVY